MNDVGHSCNAETDSKRTIMGCHHAIFNWTMTLVKNNTAIQTSLTRLNNIAFQTTHIG